MTSKIAFSLRRGTRVIHKRYGDSVVIDIVHEFGPVIIPLTIPGRLKLLYDSGMPDCPLTELWRNSFPYLVTDYKQNLK